MLVLKVQRKGKVFIGDDMVVQVISMDDQIVKLGFIAPKDIQIMREKLIPEDDPRHNIK